ncbi:MAG TPA: pitrilysin family protein [Dehalococcoidia bacterium]|nr:pitrilysin family protein [Dehalococcoidia bacterium]
MTATPEITTLDNGLRVVTTPVPTAQSVSVNVFVGAGSRGESQRTKGVAHFLEHMLFKGTPRRPTAINIAEAIEGAGGTLNAYTAKEVTCYWNHVPFDRLELALDVLSDMLYNSLFDAEELERERSVVQQEIRRSKDQPAAWTGELLVRAFYGDHPLGWPTAGDEETVAALARQDFLDWLAGWYTPSNIVVSVAGKTSQQEVVSLTERYFDGKRPAASASFLPANGDMPAERLTYEERTLAQANLALGMPGLPRNHPDRYALMVLNSLLGRGMSSRLFKEVRERRGLAYAVGSSHSRHADAGMFIVSAGVAPDNLEEAIRVIIDELERLCVEAVPEEELAKARDYTIGSFRLSLESPMALAQRAGESLITLGEIESVESVVGKLAAVRADDLQRLAVGIFQRSRIALSIVGPRVKEDALLNLLAA